MTANGSRVVPLALRSRVLATIRGGLAIAGLAAAAAVSGRPALALIGGAIGAGISALLLRADPRGRRERQAEPLPVDATVESGGEIARTDVFPSTFGLSVLAAASLAFQPMLAAVLAGILAGMAILTLVSWLEVLSAEAKEGGTLYVERRSRRLFVAGKPPREAAASTTPTRSPRG